LIGAFVTELKRGKEDALMVTGRGRHRHIV
jgi:hypothetical protein